MPAPLHKTGADDFLNSESDKNDYDWYVVFFIIYLAIVFISANVQ